MTRYNFHGMTPADLRAYAQQSRNQSAESYERSGSDGFLSQAASDVTALVYELQAKIVEGGGTWEFPALFDLDGNLVPAKYIETRYGMAWALLDSSDPDGRFTGFFNESQAQRKGVARKTDAKKGYYVGRVLAPAYADVSGGMTWYAITKRDDNGFSADNEIVDNGVGDTDLHIHYDIWES